MPDSMSDLLAQMNNQSEDKREGKDPQGPGFDDSASKAVQEALEKGAGKGEDATSESSSETETGSDETPESESESASTETAESETDEDKPLTVEDVKKLILGEQPIPDGVDATIVRCAKSEIRSEAAELTSEAYKKRIKDNPTELLTTEQKEELDTLFQAGDRAAYEARKEELISAAQEALDNDPELQKYREAVTTEQRVALVKKLCKENGMSEEDFEKSVSLADFQAYKRKDLTLEEYFKRTHANWQAKSGKKIYKGETPPKVVKGTRSASATPTRKSDADIMRAIVGGGKPS